MIESAATPKPVLVSWSGGKDSSLALHKIMGSRDLAVESLLTTITRDYDRISMHGVRTELLKRQADSIRIPLHQVFISKAATNAEYEAKLGDALSEFRARGITTVAFGDLFLEDIKTWRDQFLARHGMDGLYPIWKCDTAVLIREFIASGFKAIIVCVDPKQLDARFAGREIDEELLRDLPASCDPCGENGEFHTYVYDGPIFRSPVRVSRGETVCRDGFWFCDLIPDA